MTKLVESKSKVLAGGTFDKRWVNFSRIFSAVFVLDGERLSPERYENDCDILRQKVLIAQNSRLLRLMTRTIIVPVYCADKFADSTLQHLYKRQRRTKNNTEIYPVLFDSINMVAIAKEAAQNNNLLIYPHLEGLFKLGEAQARSTLKNVG